MYLHLGDLWIYTSPQCALNGCAANSYRRRYKGNLASYTKAPKRSGQASISGNDPPLPLKTGCPEQGPDPARQSLSAFALGWRMEDAGPNTHRGSLIWTNAPHSRRRERSMQSCSFPGGLISAGDVPSPLPFLWRFFRLRLCPSPHFFQVSQLLNTFSNAGAAGPETEHWSSVLCPGRAPRESSTETLLCISSRWLTLGTRDPSEEPGALLPVFPSCVCVLKAAPFCWQRTFLSKLAFSRVIFEGKNRHRSPQSLL